MADAQIVGGIRAIVIIPGKSGLARDVFVNSFAFRTHGGVPVDDGFRDQVASALASFYLNGASGINPISSYFGQYADRGANKAVIKTYDMNEAPPRTPLSSSFTLAAMSGSAVAMPNEVAACLSFKASTQKGPRGKGRVFVGPLNGGVVVETSDNTLRPSTAFMNSLLNAGVVLRAAGVDPPVPEWCIYSTFGPTHLHPVTDLWVDNEFDTIRKRGERATSRVTA